MATIRVREWTKEQLEEISRAEGHSSHDSVVKTLLKDRELAQFAGQSAPSDGTDGRSSRNPSEKAFDDLTVLAEFERADNGLFFLWCPNCGNEVAHIELENPVSMSVFEAECQRCLTRLDQHALVAIEIGYPIEERIVDEALQTDLQSCVVDYWDRRLGQVADGTADGATDGASLVWEFTQYLEEFGWDWPEAVPVVAVEPGGVYRNEATDEVIEVRESISEDPHGVGAFRAVRYPDLEAFERENGEPVTLESSSVVAAITDRDLVALSGNASASEQPV